jgi:hypothetical protein
MEAETAIAQTLTEVEKTTGQRILGVRIVRYKGGPDGSVAKMTAETSAMFYGFRRTPYLRAFFNIAPS